jgi:hypothetical protein
MTWQPIETHPKDGIDVLLLTRRDSRGRSTILHGRWMTNGFWVGFTADRAVQRIEPTHWMDLPPPPAMAPTGEKP